MTLGEIIKEYRTERRISMEEFARLVGLSKAYISILERNHNPSNGRQPKPTMDTIAAVASVVGMSLNEIFRKLDVETTVNISAATDEVPRVTKRPRLGSIACGAPILAEQNIEGYDQVPDYIKCDFTLVCKGDSMIGARIHDGDIVCIKQQPEVENGQIAAVLIDDEATLKRVRYQGDGIVLWPENPRYEPMIFTGGNVNRVKILGLATHFISRVV